MLSWLEKLNAQRRLNRILRMGAVTGGVLAVLLGAQSARAEYRAYELEVVDHFECKVSKRESCLSTRIFTSMTPYLYVKTHGGMDRIGAIMIATWMCYGDTSRYRAVCPRPPAIKPRYGAGDNVEIALEKHVTHGWRGTVEVVYYQASVRSNVYGVRFSDRRNVYARYFEKDLIKPKAVAGDGGAEAAQPAAVQPEGAQPAEPQPASAQPAAVQPEGAQPAESQPASAQPAAVQPAPGGTTEQ